MESTDKKVQKKTVLLAEDDPVCRKIITKILGEAGFQVHIAVTGVEVVSLFSQVKPDLILMDVRMPELDGLTAVRMIREIEKPSSRNVPVIAVTAYALKGDREICLEAGMDDYLTKPFDIGDLLAITRQWL
ncbi:response regulator [Desulfosporosinus sp. Sb-LF]|uniref:response regulator n=1 Tax=Desulfosporosinus sp. Sb-LF TaxID=2560027 RepID=UPI0013051133|nr:response regulator [Desulfosporosinus sp. Sb-LF]